MPDLAGLKVAYLTFCGLIDSTGVGRIAATINQAVNESYDEVYLCVTSLGGYVGDGIFLYNHIRAMPIRVTMHNTGTMASIAATLFTAGQRRVCSPNAIFMMHPVSVGGGSTPMAVEPLQAALRAAGSDEARTEAILRERTTMSDQLLTGRRFTDIYLTAEDALGCGLTHEIADFSLPPGNQIFHI